MRRNSKHQHRDDRGVDHQAAHRLCRSDAADAALVAVCVLRSKQRLNQPKKPRTGRFAVRWPFCTGLSSVAQSAGVRISATSTDSSMAETMVTENWR